MPDLPDSFPESSTQQSSDSTSPRNKPPFSGRVLWYVGFVIIVGLVGIGALLVKTASTLETVAPAASVTNRANSTLRPVTPTPDGIIKVYITGEVQKPGVYQVQTGDRVIDVVTMAGGFTEQADQNRVEQATRVRDEMRIVIPHLAIAATVSAVQTTSEPGKPPQGLTPATTTVSSNNSSRMNINTATAAELDKLPGVGAVLSQRIIDYRTKNGPFKNLDDLRKVDGLSKSIIEKIKDLVEF